MSPPRTSRKSIPSCAALMLLALLGMGSGCERTREAIEEDTRAAAERAGAAAEQTKLALESEAQAFKAKANARLAELEGQIARLSEKAESKANSGAEKLSRELEDARRELAELDAKGSSEWKQAKAKLEERLGEIGKRIDDGLETAGERVEKALD